MRSCVRMALGMTCIVLVFLFSRGQSACGQQADGDQGQASVDGSEPIRDGSLDLQNLDAAIGLIEAMAADPPLDPQTRGRYQDIVKNLKGARGEKEKNRRIRKGGLARGKGGCTRGAGANPLTKELRIATVYVGAGEPGTTPFVDLVDTVFHEGVHLGQDLPSPIPPAFGKEPMPPEKAKEALEWKKKVIAVEDEAYEFGREFKSRIRDATEKMRDNVKNGLPPMGEPGTDSEVPAWAGGWATTDLVFLNHLAHKAADQANSYLKAVNKLGEVEETIKAKEESKMDTDAIVRQVNKHDAWKIYCGLDWYMVLDSSSPVIHGASGREWPGWGFGLQTEIPYPQDLEVIEDKTGRYWILVCGVQDEAKPRGIIRAFPQFAEEPPPKKRLPDGTEYSPDYVWFDDFNGKTIVADDPRLGRPTSILAAPDGRVFVWDVDDATLYLLRDINQDGVPDDVDFDRGSLVKPSKGLGLSHFADVMWIGNQPVAQLRVVDTAVGGDPMMFFHDGNKDGYFESVLPLSGLRVPEKPK